MINKTDLHNYRKTEFTVNNIFVERWSPRAMSGEEITVDDLMPLFEAARWAPSSMNSQPWRFIYARRNTEHWDKLFDLLAEMNKVWCKNAGALVLILSRKTFEYNNKPSRTHSFDTGAAWVSAALQASDMGLIVHGMSGFDYDQARAELNIPDEFNIEAMFAVGKPGDPAGLPEPIREREKPSTRKSVKEIAFEGGMD